MLADFRSFCKNEDNRLKEFWEDCKNHLTSAELKDLEKVASGMDMPNFNDE